jgi:CRISPR-associated protein Csn2
MLKLNFEFLDEPIELDGLTSLVIEDRVVFTKVVQKLFQYQGEEDYLKLFDENYHSLKTSEIMMMTDILGYDVNSATTLKLIYKDIEDQLNEKPEVKTKIEELLGDATALIQDELVEFEIDLLSDEIEIAEALKVLGVKIEIETDTIFERMFEIIQVFKYLKSKRLLIFVNTSLYLTEEELRSLEEYVELQNMNLLMIDAVKVEGTKSRYVLDSDYVLMHEYMV